MLYWSLRIGMGALVVVILALMGLEARGFQALARYFPLTAASLGVVIGLGSLAQDVVRWRSGAERQTDLLSTTAVIPEAGEASEDEPLPFAQTVKISAYYMAWIIAYVVAIWLIGLIASSAVFLLLFLRLEARLSYTRTVICAVAVVLFLYYFGGFMDLHWPDSIVGLE